MDEQTRKKLANHEARLRKLETLLRGTPQVETAERPVERRIEEPESNEPSFFDKITFTQVITFLGILGIVIGLISFFFYAVANQWIGPQLQIILGMLTGLILFVIAYYVRESKPVWSNIVFGGAFFVEYLAIGIGVLRYHTLPSTVGIFLCLVLLIGGVLLAIKFESRMIAYFAIAGGYLMPFITGTYRSSLFTLGTYVLLSAGLVYLSAKQNWPDLRIVSFFVVMIFTISYIDTIRNTYVVPILFLLAIFILYHIACIVSSLTHKQDTISVFDAIILVLLPIFFFSLLASILRWPINAYSLIILCFALLQLGEMYYLKQQNVSRTALYALLATGIVALNLGILFLIHGGALDVAVFYLILFAVQQALFSIIAANTKEMFYKVFSYIALGLSAIWIFQLLFSHYPVAEATILLVAAIGITLSLYSQAKTNVDSDVSNPGFIVSGFITLFLVAKYTNLLMYPEVHRLSSVAQIVLSILWLVYSLYLYTQAKDQQSKVLAGILLGITLCKIAFIDLFFLHGASRIVGFMVFGVLLLVGGYLIRK